MKPTLFNTAVLVVAAGLLAIATAVGYKWAKASMAKDIYRDRLVQAQAEYQDLAQQYNQAITPRPVTELLVDEGRVCVVVRKGKETVTVPTDFDVRENQVYVDYLLEDNRLLIRRVFEFNRITAVPPDKVVYVDPELLEVDWDPESTPYGLALSSSNLTDGRYIISVTANGSLGFEKIDDDAPIDLADRPYIREFDPAEEQADTDAASIGIGDVWRYLTQ
ncbi:MAG: hypothetical protein AAGC44_08630 [Planctomycetota bacterium]